MKNDNERRKAKDNVAVGELAKDAIRFAELTDHLLPCGTDLTLLVLKGHLVAEQLLEIILARLLRVSELPGKPGRLQFFQKLKLVEKVVCEREPGPSADLLCVLDTLNDVRNKLAHGLKTPKEIEGLVQSLIQCYYTKKGQKLPKGWQKDIYGHLTICLFALCQFLLKIRLHSYELEKY